MTEALAVARQILDDGVGVAYPAVVAEVGRAAGPVWEHAAGRLSDDADAPAVTPDTPFDLASLTKVLSTTALMMRAVDDGRLALDDPVRRWIPRWESRDRREVTLEDLLEHCAGLTAHLPFFRDHTGRAEFEAAIATGPLEYEPRTRSIYSDLGFILLGFVAADVWRQPLAEAFASLAGDATWSEIGFGPDPSTRSSIAATELDPWRGRRLQGEVHDENAWALGGAAGHAGLFGTARSVGRVARDLLAAWRGVGPTWVGGRTVQRFARRSTVPGSSRALGWDTMLPTSSCGTRLSPGALGHTGFTGTSLWIDPPNDLYVVLLSNRVCPTRENQRILSLRPAFHDAVAAAMLAS